MKPQKNPPSRQALPRLALALILAVFAAPGARAVNAIINDNFTAGTDPWTLKLATGAAATLDSSSGWGRAVISGGGSSKSTVNLEQTLSQPLLAGLTYTISFDARADSAKSIDVLLRNNSSVFGGAYGVSLTTTSERKTVTYTRPATDPDVTDARLSFRIGGNNITTYIDNVVVTRQGLPSSLLSWDPVAKTWSFPTVSVPINGTSPTQYKSFNAGAYDFSYAGYRYGEREDFVGIPPEVFHVAAPGADNDITDEINSALAGAAANGGGTVRIPAGTFFIGKGKIGKAINVSSDNTVIKGAGIGNTTLVVHSSYHSDPLTSSYATRRDKSYSNGVITFSRGNDGSWYDGSRASNVAKVAATVGLGSRSITVSDPSNTLSALAAGDTIVIRQIFSRKFNEDHALWGMNNSSQLKPWRWTNYLQNPDKTFPVDPATGKNYPLFSDGSFSYSYLRKVMSHSVSGTTRVIHLDVPIPQRLEPPSVNADNQDITVIRRSPQYALLTNCGLADLTLTAEDEADGNNADEDSTGATVLVTGLHHGLFKNIEVDRFRTLGLATNYPINVSFINCTTSDAINRNGGGAGYGFYIKGQNLLYKNCKASEVRHGFTTAASQTSNIVVKNCITTNLKFHSSLTTGEAVDDTHLQYAHGILFDNHYSNDAGLLMINRQELSLQAWETCGWSIVWNYQNEGNNTLSSTSNDLRRNLIGITPLEFGLVIGAHSGRGRGLVTDSRHKLTAGIRVVDGYTRVAGDNQPQDDWGVAITNGAAQVGGVSKRVMFEHSGSPVAESIYDIQFAQRAKLLP